MFYLYIIFFIRNISKHVNYIRKYLDSQICVSKCILHLYRLLFDQYDDGQSRLIV